jgi:acyl carrier protein
VQLARRNTYHAPLPATIDGGVERVLPYVSSFSLDSFLEHGGKCGLSTATAANGNGHPVSAARTSVDSRLSLSSTSSTSESSGAGSGGHSPARIGARSTANGDGNGHGRGTVANGNGHDVSAASSSVYSALSGHPLSDSSGRSSSCHSLETSGSPPRDGEVCADPRSSLDLDPSPHASLLTDLSDIFAGVIAVDAPEAVQQTASQAAAAAAAPAPAQLDGVILDFGPGTGTLAMTARLTTGVVMRARDLVRDAAQCVRSDCGARVVPAELRSQITAVVQSVLGDDVVNDPDEAFNVDSRLALRIHGAIEKATDLSLPVTLCFDYPTVAAVSDFVTHLLRADTDTPPPPQHLAAGEGSTVALCQVGAVRSKLPVSGAAIADSDSSQQPLSPVPDSLAHVPFVRWDANVPPAFDSTSKPLARFGGFVTDVEEFDAQLFGCGSSESTLMDPQQRLLMELSMRALAAARVTSSFGGVVVGSFVHEYAALVPLERGPLRGSSFSATGISSSVMAGRLSFTYGLR